jgi:hypothetical protein
MKTGGVALVLSALALGAAIVALTREPPQPQRASGRMERVTELETEVAELAHEVALLKGERAAGARRNASGPEPAAPPATGGETSDVPGDETSIAAIVDDAVDRKTKKVIDDLRVKADKKPAIDLFSSVLELTTEQREAAERVIVEGQRSVHQILNTPTADGINLMDELVEIFAKGIADPGKDHGFGRWIGRLLSEKIPGTDVTYGKRIEAVKESMRATFKKEWTVEQFKEFQEWGLDPTEIQKVPGSPNEALEKRILARASVLGAEIPREE